MQSELAVFLAEFLEFGVAAEVLVEQVAGDEKVFYTFGPRLLEDVLQGVVSFGVFGPSPEVYVRCY
jgi:hypothetical protein